MTPLSCLRASRINLNACAAVNFIILGLLALHPCKTVKYNYLSWQITIPSEGIV